MKHYIDPKTNKIFAYAADGSQDAFIGDGLTLLTDEELTALRAPSQSDIIAGYIAQLQAHLDQAAQANGYDDIKSAALRAGYAGPFHDEGVIYATWMDACWSTGLDLIAQYEAGEIGLLTFQQVLDILPILDLS